MLNNVAFNHELDVMPEFSNFVDLLRYRYESQAQSVAINYLADGELSSQIPLDYAQLMGQVYSMASWLQAHYKEQSRILLLFPSGNEFIVSFLACMCAKMIAVPCVLPNRREQDWNKTYAIVRDCSAAAVITTEKYVDSYREKFSNKCLNSICDVLEFNQLIEFNNKTYCPLEVVPQDIAFLQYTSGSTGNPKGVMVSHRNLMHNQKVLKAGFKNDSQTRYVSWLPLFHDMGLIGCALQSLYLGVVFNYMSPVSFLQKPIRWLRAISHFSASTSGAPNFAYELCISRVNESQCQGLDLSAWKCAFNGAEQVRASTLQRFYEKYSKYGLSETALYPCYGLAEGTLMVTGRTEIVSPKVIYVNRDRLDRGQVIVEKEYSPTSQAYVGVGDAGGNQLVRVVNALDSTICRNYRVGEIWVKGPSVAEGYWENKDQTEKDFKAFTSDTHEGPFLRTGDVGFIGSNNELYICSRIKDLIILNGRNIYPQDLEQCCEASCDALRLGGSAAFSVDKNEQEQLVIVQELKRTALRNVNYEKIISKIRSAISDQYQISVYDVVLIKPGSLFKTSSGKVQRQANKSAYLNNKFNKLAHYLEVQLNQKNISRNNDLGEHDNKTHSEDKLTYNELEQWVFLTIEKKIGVNLSLDSDSHFVDTGMDSVFSIELCQLISDRFSISVDPTKLWEHTRIKDFVCYLVELANKHSEMAGQSSCAQKEVMDNLTNTPKRDFSHLSTSQLLDILKNELNN